MEMTVNDTLKWFLVIPSLVFNQRKAELPNFEVMKKMVGKWSVKSTDRIKLGYYEHNSGQSVIDVLFQGKSIEETYDGELHESPYSFKSILTLQGGNTLQEMWMDGTHGKLMLLDGRFEDGVVEVGWRKRYDTQIRTIKHVYSDIDDHAFVTETQLSVDEGQRWELLHRREYSRIR